MKRKTYKREVAVALLIFWAYCVFGVDLETLRVITLPTFGFAMGAYGLDAWAKQLNGADDVRGL